MEQEQRHHEMSGDGGGGGMERAKESAGWAASGVESLHSMSLAREMQSLAGVGAHGRDGHACASGRGGEDGDGDGCARVNEGARVNEDEEGEDENGDEDGCCVSVHESAGVNN